MLARKFRILFHNVEQGIFCTGSLFDEELDEGFTYVYAGGSQENYPEPTLEEDYYQQLGDSNLLILSDFNIPQIKKVLAVLRHSSANIVVYPYTPPIQRMVIMREAITAGESDQELLSFIKDPYKFLKRKQIVFVYPLLGNGPKYDGCQNKGGHHFELAEEKYIQCATELEGYQQPIVKAGYILKNQWLMFLGVYGLDLEVTKDFCKNRAEKEFRSNARSTPLQMESRMISAYLAEFGRSSFGTIVMYSAPMNGGPSVDDSMLMVKTLGNMRNCRPILTPESEMCSAYCMYRDDHDECKRHNQRNMINHIQGIMFLGSLNLGKYRKDLMERFLAVAESIRFFTVPNNGRVENWDKSFINWGAKGHRKYWIGDTKTEARVIKDIVGADPYNRFMTVNRTCGVCIFGFLARITKGRFDKKSNEHQI